MNSSVLQLKLPTRTIPIHYGTDGMAWVGEEIAVLFGNRRPKVLIVSDEQVALHYLQELESALGSRKLQTMHVIIQPGEAQKTLQRAAGILDILTDRQFARDDLVIGLGGGVVTDMAGFAAAIYRRGMNWIAVPTSLMGMVDAAIGGKTGVNHPQGKNLIGSFYQPLAIFAPLKTLATLEPREWLSGSAEVVKSALIAGGELWNDVLAHGPNLQEWPEERRNRAIRQAAAVKIRIVEQDERESDWRRVLNLGHTLAHALEAVTDYRVYTHGEAVFTGLRGMIFLSRELKRLNNATAKQVDDLLSQATLPALDIEPEKLFNALAHDKKTIESRLNWVLLEDIGKPVITADVPLPIVRKTIEHVANVLAEGIFSEWGRQRLRMLVINGPNLNLLGTREPEIYGSESYDDLVRDLEQYAQQRDVEILIRQSNYEGELVELVQRARHWADGIIINPGGYTHTSVALRDAIAAIDVPAVEVHLSDIASREEFRRQSLISPVCITTITGQGIDGYRQALDSLTAHR